MRSLVVRSLVAALASCLLGVSVGQSNVQQPIGCQTFYDGFVNPYDVATDSNGNIYVADNGLQQVVRVGANGGATVQQYLTMNPPLANPDGLCLDSSNNVYVVDSGNQRVLKFANNGNPATPFIVASNVTSSTNPILNYPWNCAVDNTNNFLYISNTAATPQGITKLSTANNAYTQVAYFAAGNPTSDYPNQVALDTSGNVYVADSTSFRVIKYSNNGTQLQVFNMPTNSYPNGVAVDTNGAVYVTATSNNYVAVFNSNGAAAFNITTSNPSMSSPRGIWTDSSNNIFIADSGNRRIVKLYSSTSGYTGGNTNCGQAPTSSSVNSYSVTSLYPTSGTGSSTPLNNPYDVALDGSNNLYIADTFNNRAIQMSTGGAVSVVYTTSNPSLASPNGLCLDSASPPNVYVVDTNNARVIKFTNGGTQSQIYANASFTPGLGYPWNCAVDSSGNLYISNTVGQVISVANTAGTQIGVYNVAALYPNQIAIDGSNNLYVADSNDFRITKFSIATAQATPAGTAVTILQTFTLPQYSYPNGVAVDSAGNVYATDTNNGTIVQWNSTGTLQQIFVLPSTTEALNNPRGMAISSGGTLYVADTSSNRIVAFNKGGSNGASTAQASTLVVVGVAALLSLFFGL